jgi:ZIP family zinc transporter
MHSSQIVMLGFVAGATIVLGLPLGRLRSPRHSRATAALRVYLTAASIGVLVFILWDLLAQAWEILTASLGEPSHSGEHLDAPIGLATLMFGGLGVGLLSLAGYERWLTRTPAPRQASAGKPSVTTLGAILGGPGAMSVTELSRTRRAGRTLSPARRLALLIAVGIGLHNFGEGLALGGSAAQGKIALATLLVTGFALHNATEGFGIIAPLAADAERPSWGFLLLMGAIGGAPTLLGTVVGSQFTSDPMSLLFLTVAAGSILYVIIQLVAIAVKGARRTALYWGVWTGIVAGFATDLLLTAGGA